jgi:hypothetical protein
MPFEFLRREWAPFPGPAAITGGFEQSGGNDDRTADLPAQALKPLCNVHGVSDYRVF